MRKRSHRTRAAALRAPVPELVLYERCEHGLGTLEVSGQPSLTMAYKVDIDARVSQGDGAGGVRSRLRVVGRVIPEEPWTLVPYVGVATLVLEDGRRWACRVVDSDGRLANDAADPPFTLEPASPHGRGSVSVF